MKKIILFASGAGSNAENIIRYFAQHGEAKVVAVFCNNPGAGVIPRAALLGVPTVIFTKEELQSQSIAPRLNAYAPDLIVLAGFLLMVPEYLIAAYPNKIINIHPALLPKYGGKGMYGMSVHRAIRENNEPETGISIHYVDKHYDEGDIIFQAKVTIDPADSAEDIARKVHQLEHEHFPKVIAQLLRTGKC